MRTYEEYREILTLWEAGTNKKAISRMTGIPRPTVRDCIERYGSLQGLEDNRERASRSTPDEVLNRIQDSENVEVQQAYAYLLGLYLGDGEISRSKAHRVYRLRVALDQKYPDIIQCCICAIETLLPNNKVSIVQAIGCVIVSCYHKFWPSIFPQDGEGRKHEREIKLEEWQLQIVDAYPLEFFRGLYHSDGSRDKNVVKGKEYPRYSFRNFSKDIQRLFCLSCNLLGLHWTVASNGTSINVSKRKDVAYLDSVIGPKS